MSHSHDLNRLFIVKSLYCAFVVVCLTLLQLTSFSQVVEGRISDNDGKAMPYASVYVDQSTFGVTTNLNGQYFLELNPGEYVIVYSFIGYEPVRKSIRIGRHESLTIHITLTPSATEIFEVEIVADKRDRATEIIKQAISSRKEHRCLIRWICGCASAF